MFNGFIDRRDAGKHLAAKLVEFHDAENTVVLALPRGGVPVAAEVARELELPLDILVVRKLGVPGHEEFAFGAVASGGHRFVNEGLTRSLKMPESVIARVVESELEELSRRERLYRGQAPPTDLDLKTVILVDDGLATGATMRVAVEAARARGAGKIVVAVPVASHEACEQIGEADDVWCVCYFAPEPFYAVGLWYSDFSQTTDEEVCRLLREVNADRTLSAAAVH